MAAGSLLALIDDIATILDDVSLMTKVAAKNTAGVLGDDLALNAQQVSGVNPERELPVVWAVAKGSMVNKAILVPAALAISAVAPQLITPLLMFGGLYLCFEGVEKLAHKFLHNKSDDDAHREQLIKAFSDEKVDLVAVEKDKIKGAIRTDFILSAEIIVISLGTVVAASFMQKAMVLVAISLVMTVGVYGLVAGIVKLDDFGLYLSQKSEKLKQKIGNFLLNLAPYLMKALSIIGTAAMFMVGGAIIVHGITPLHHLIIEVAQHAAGNGFLASALEVLFNALTGIVSGTIALLMWMPLSKLFTKLA